MFLFPQFLWFLRHCNQGRLSASRPRCNAQKERGGVRIFNENDVNEDDVAHLGRPVFRPASVLYCTGGGQEEEGGGPFFTP